MAFSLTDKKSLERLRSDLRWSDQQLYSHRTVRKALLQELAGFTYGNEHIESARDLPSEHGTSDRRGVNLIRLAAHIFQRLLGSANVNALVTSQYTALQRQVALLELALNYVLKVTGITESVRMALLDSFFGMGLVKVGVEISPYDRLPGYRSGLYRPFVEYLSFDDLVIDMRARSWGKANYVGHRFWMTLDDLKADESYDQDIVEKLSASKMATDERKALSVDAPPREDGIEPSVELMELYFPRLGQLAVLTCEKQADYRVLRVTPYEGPRGGPIIPLWFEELPNEIIPVPPAAHWIDQQLLVNKLFNKAARQAVNQRTILGYMGAAHSDAERLANASDDDMIRIDNPQGTQTYSFGGANQGAIAMYLQGLMQFKTNEGNLDSLGGLSPQSRAVGVSQLLDQNSSRQLADMQRRVMDFNKRIVEAVAYYLWTDPLIELPVIYRSGSIESVEIFSPEMRNGDFFDFNIEVDPFSVQDLGPASRLSVVHDTVQNLLLPAMPYLQQQGISVDLGGYLKMLSRYTHTPEIEQLIIQTDTPDGSTQDKYVQPPGDAPRKPPNSHRVYERVNTPGANNRQQEYVMANAALGGRLQPDEEASISRITG